MTLLVGVRIYSLWLTGPWDLPQAEAGKGAPPPEEPKPAAVPPQPVSTEIIISKNLFDPERGAGWVGESDASSLALQRIRNMVLMGTAILGDARYALMQEPTDPRVLGLSSKGRQLEQLRLKVGDTVAGFTLSEISEKKVVFAKGPTKVEVALDFLRKVEAVQPQGPATPPAQVPPRVVPNIPRRVRPIPPPVVQ